MSTYKMEILNLTSSTPEWDSQPTIIHIRVQQRNSRKMQTTISGLSADIDHAKILKTLRKLLCCGGHLVDDPVYGQVIQLQGDYREKCAEFLVREDICTNEQIQTHGASQ